MENKQIELRILADQFSVCQISSPAYIPFEEEFVFVGKTDEELSLVCRTQAVPVQTAVREDGWRALKIQGVLDFSLVGILAGITSILADAKISVFAVSTYNTDYLFIRKDFIEQAEDALRENGYTFL